MEHFMRDIQRIPEGGHHQEGNPEDSQVQNLEPGHIMGGSMERVVEEIEADTHANPDVDASEIAPPTAEDVIPPHRDLLEGGDRVAVQEMLAQLDQVIASSNQELETIQRMLSALQTMQAGILTELDSITSLLQEQLHPIHPRTLEMIVRTTGYRVASLMVNRIADLYAEPTNGNRAHSNGEPVDLRRNPGADTIEALQRVP